MLKDFQPLNVKVYIRDLGGWVSMSINEALHLRAEGVHLSFISGDKMVLVYYHATDITHYIAEMN